jgi:AraC family transcriptional regulator
VAAAANSSLFWFHRIFSAMTGDTMKEYIRKRRLSIAAQDLVQTDRRVIDIALRAGFASQEAFTRVFKDQFLTTPARFRKTGLWYPVRTRIDIDTLRRVYLMRSGQMEPVIKTMESLTVVGPQLATKNDGTNNKEIPLFWQKFMADKGWEKIPQTRNPWVQLGLCGDMAEGSESFVYMIGQIVDGITEIPPGMVARTVPAATYAVFTARGPIPDAIHKTWKYAYGTWLPGSSEWMRGKTEDFEWYCERCQQETPEVDIYIPVVPKI